mgnify:CR=1 FL=1
MVETQYKTIVDEQLKLAKGRVSSFLVPIEKLGDTQARAIIGTYRVAVEPNFIPWMLQAYETARSQKAKRALKQNINDEISQNHPKMLRDFAQSCGVVVSEEHYRRAAQPVLEMWSLFTRQDNLRNIGIAATLESTSQVFIPYLAEIGRKLRCTNFTYTDVHGEADIEHARDLHEGLVQEMEHSATPWRTVATAVDKTTKFLESILTIN